MTDKVENLLIQSKTNEAKKTLRSLRKKSLNPDQGELVEKMLDDIAQNVLAKKRQNDDIAKLVGRRVRLAEEVYYNHREAAIGSYSKNLNELLGVDKNLTDNPSVTFRFLYASSKGYTFYTTHQEGTGKTFLYHD